MDMHSGLPCPGEAGQFLIKHSEYGWMLSRWCEISGCFVGGSFVDISGFPLGRWVKFQAEQISLATHWTKLGD